MTHLDAAVTFAATLPALLVSHHVADHWVQREGQALAKHRPGWPGRWACGKHVVSYTVVTAATVAVLWGVLGLAITPAGFAAGQLVSAVTHYWADRRTTLAKLADAVGKGGFFALGAPRQDRDDNPTLGTGAYVLDQAWHWLWLLVAALITASI